MVRRNPLRLLSPCLNLRLLNLEQYGRTNEVSLQPRSFGQDGNSLDVLIWQEGNLSSWMREATVVSEEAAPCLKEVMVPLDPRCKACRGKSSSSGRDSFTCSNISISG